MSEASISYLDICKNIKSIVDGEIIGVMKVDSSDVDIRDYFSHEAYANKKASGWLFLGLIKVENDKLVMSNKKLSPNIPAEPLTKAGLLDEFYLLLGLETSGNGSFELRLLENNYDTDEKIELTDDQKETLSSVFNIIKEKLSA